MADPPMLTDLSEAERAHARARFAIIRPFLEDGVPLPALAGAQHPALRTPRSCVARYRQHGLIGLARQPRADRGVPRRLTPALRTLIEGLALQRPPPTAAQVHRHAVRVATEHGWPVPSYRTVAACIQRLDPGLVTLAHAGATVYRETFDVLYRREARCANEIWQADHTLLDLWARDEHGTPMRPWLTVILDDYSRAVAGYRLSVHAPSSCGTRSGARPIRAGISAASPLPSTPTMAATSPQSISNRSPSI
jgi:putative transposase